MKAKKRLRNIRNIVADALAETMCIMLCITALVYATWEIGHSMFLLWYPGYLEEKYGIVVDKTYSDGYNNTDDIYCALRTLPEDVLKRFAEEGWKLGTWNGDTDAFFNKKGISVSKEYRDCMENNNYKISGLTRSGDTREIYICDAYKDKYGTTIHEFGHFIDHDMGRLSETPLFAAIIRRNDYTTYESSVSGKKDNYCDTNNHEYFAVTFEDYMTHYSYVEENYPEIAEYYNTVVLPEYE